MSCLSILNILIYIYLSIFQDLFLGIINDFLFIYSHTWFSIYLIIYVHKKVLFEIRFFKTTEMC